ncbi:MAG: hypothetical protein CSB55_06485 [Candidatus Cloacimonadota bacterium]|nr:MAG: hypothetical protein CSB55_06485 [Candidatus Cloacimonadota bacterium]
MKQNIRSDYLNNGLKVIVAEDHSHPLISMQLYVRVGGLKESDETAGFSHFCEHLVFKATEKYPENKIMKEVAELGGEINAYTDYDATCFYITLPKNCFAQGLDFLSQLVTASKFTDEEFKSEKKVVLEELKQHANDPLDYFSDSVAENYFKKSNYKRPIIGYEDVLQKSTVDQLRDYISHNYAPNNSFLVISGDVSFDEIKPFVNNFFGNWKEKTIKPQISINEDFPASPGLHRIKLKSEHDYLAFVFPEISEKDERNHSLSLALKAFAYGQNSRLYKRLYTKESLIDSMHIHSYCGVENGISAIIVLPKKNTDPEKIIEIFKDENAKLYERGLRSDEIEREKKEIIFSYRYAFEYIESLGTALGSEEVNGDYKNFLNYPDKIKNINAKNIKKVIKEFLNPDIMQIYYAGKQEISEEIATNHPVIRRNSRKNFSSYPEFRQYKFENGCNVLMKKVIGKPTVGITASFNVSQLYETPKMRGTNLITSAGMMYGNEKNSYEQFVRECSSAGINFNVSASKEISSVKIKCFGEALPKAINMLADTVLTPVFPKNHIENIKRTYLGNISRIKDYPPQYSNYLWKEMLLGKKSNLLSRTGMKSDLKKVNLKKIKQWHEIFYHPSNMTLCLIGDFEFDDVLEQIEDNFQKIPAKSIPIKRNLFTDKTTPCFKRINKKSNQSIIRIGGFGCNSEIPQKNTDFWVLSQIIGGDFNSRMYEQIREKKGFAYSLNFESFSIEELGIFHAVAIVDKKTEEESRKYILHILEDIRLNGVTEHELAVAKKYLSGARLMESESMSAQSSALSYLIATGYSYDYYLEREKRLQNVSLESIHEIADKYFAKENLYTLIYA